MIKNLKIIGIVISMVFATSIFAANPSQPFLPSDNVQDPNCTPADSNCYVNINSLQNGGNSYGQTLTLGTNDNQALRFETNGIDKMSILANGNVGIGDTAPTSQLVVANATGTQSVLTLKAAAGGQSSPFLSFVDASGATTFEMRAYGSSSANTVAGLDAGALIVNNPYNSGTYGLITTGTNNTIYGYQAGQILKTGSENTLIGYQAGKNLEANGGDPLLTAALNTFVGAAAGGNTTTGYANVFIGQKAGVSNTGGSANVYIGKSTGANAYGARNAYIGTVAGEFAGNGVDNTYIGWSAGNMNTGTGNTVVGSGAGTNALGHSGNNNVVMGMSAMNGQSSSSQNVVIGQRAGRALTASFAANNVIIGYRGAENFNEERTIALGNETLQNVTSGWGNIIFGSLAGNNVGTSLYNTAMIGGDHDRSAISEVYFGRGKFSANAATVSLKATGGIGTNITGGALNIAGGMGTGSALGGSISFQTSVSTTSGSGNQNLSTRMRVDASTGFVGIGTTTPADRLQVFGDLRIGTSTGACIKDFSGTGFAGTCSSDERLKTNIVDLSDGYLDKMAKLKTITYNWNDTARDLNQVDTSVTNYGLLAQNVEESFPELVTTDYKGYKQVNYSRIPLYLIKAIQELSGKVSSLFDGTGKMKVKEMCIGSTCVNEQQLLQLLQNQNVQQNVQHIYPAPADPVPAVQQPSEPAPAEEPEQEEVPPVVDPVPVEPAPDSAPSV